MSASFICDKENRVIKIPHYFPTEDEVVMKVRNIQVNKHRQIYFENPITQKFRFELTIMYTVKVGQTGVFSGPNFLAFGLITEIYSVNLSNQLECRKIQTRKSSAFGHF